MKKRLIGILVSLMAVTTVHAQFAVVDVQSIAASIQNGIKMAQQLEATYNQIKGTYQQVENQIKNMQSMDLSQINPSTLSQLMNMADNYKQMMNNMDNLYKEKNMIVGGISFSLEDMVTTNVYDSIKKSFGDLQDAANMSAKKRKEFYQRYGVEYETFMALYGVSEQMSSKAKEIKVKTEKSKDVIEASLKFANDITEGVTGETSEAALLQKLLMVSSQNLTALTHTLDSVSNVGDLLASQMAQEMALQKESQESEMSETGLTGEQPFYVLDSVGDTSDYRGFGNRRLD
jgi:hypothetical protein